MKKFVIEFKWATIYSAVLIAWNMMEKALGFHDTRIAWHIAFASGFGVPAIVVYVLAIRDKKNNYYHGNVNWSQAFLSGMIVAGFSAVISPLVQYVTYVQLSPEYFRHMTDYFVGHKKMPADKAAAYFSLNSYILQGVSNGMSLGVIISAIVALFVRTKTDNQK